MKKKKSIEDYLKTIYILSGKKEVHGADIAGELGVSRPTVSVALKTLAKRANGRNCKRGGKHDDDQ